VAQEEIPIEGGEGAGVVACSPIRLIATACAIVAHALEILAAGDIGPEGPPLRKGLRLTSSLRGIASASYQKVLITQKVASAISNAFIYAGTIHHAQMLCGVQSCSNENADTPQLNRD